MLLIRKSESIVRVLNTTFQAYFHVGVALFKLNFPRNPKMTLHVQIAVFKLEL